MYEPFLNREKQYLKANAELDNRFKEIEQTKIPVSDIAKPRLNVFGNSSKAQNQSSVKTSQHKQKRHEIKCGNPSKSSDEVQKLIQSTLCKSVNVTGNFTDKSQKMKASASDADITRSNQTEAKVHSTNKPLDHKDSSTVFNQTLATAVTVSSSSDTTLKKNISSDGLIRYT